MVMTLEEQREKRRQRYRANREKYRKLARKYRAANLEKYRATDRQRYQVNPEKRREQSRQWAKANPEKRRATKLKLMFGLSLLDYDSILAKQGGSCAICNGPQIGKKKYLAVDHDHIDKRVRGLLCDNCNRAIGLFYDSPEVVESALRYLRKHAQLRLVS